MSNFKKAVLLVLAPARPGTADVLAAAGCLALGEPGLEESSQLPPDGAASAEASGRLRKEARSLQIAKD